MWESESHVILYNIWGEPNPYTQGSKSNTSPSTHEVTIPVVGELPISKLSGLSKAPLE
jgi:hypothetical protein